VVVLGGSLTEGEGQGDEGLGVGLARSGERKGFFSVEAAWSMRRRFADGSGVEGGGCDIVSLLGGGGERGCLEVKAWGEAARHFAG